MQAGEYHMWLLIIVTLVTGTDGGASSSVTTLQFSTQGNCHAAAKAVAQAGTIGKGTYAIKANCVQP
jgi:hypothetical protein